MAKTLEQTIGQLIIAGFRESTINPESDIIRYIKNYNISGVIIYDEDMGNKKNKTRNVISPHQLQNLIKGLQASSDNPLLISIDQEGGKVNRLKEKYGFPDFPSWNEIGFIDDIQYTKQYSELLGNCLNDVGINLNYAPVLDLDYGKSSYIGNANRALSKDPNKVIKHSSVFISELKKTGVLSCAKHFPGQGSGIGDTHKGLTDITKTWSKFELLPYQKLIEKNELKMVMISHVFHRDLDPNLPASLSYKITTELLRDEIKFKGVIICDDPSMKAISENYSLEDTFSLMINAGIDMFCLGNNLSYDVNYIPKCINAIKSGIRNKRISLDLVESSISRINKLKKYIQANE